VCARGEKLIYIYIYSNISITPFICVSNVFYWVRIIMLIRQAIRLWRIKYFTCIRRTKLIIKGTVKSLLKNPHTHYANNVYCTNRDSSIESNGWVKLLHIYIYIYLFIPRRHYTAILLCCFVETYTKQQRRARTAEVSLY
jgi:hypothetical protein